MHFYALRHGLSESNKLGKTNSQSIDDLLSKDGIGDIEKLIEKLPEGIIKIYSSDLKRAKETSEIINKVLNIPLVLMKELREVNLGELTGMSWMEITEKYGNHLNEEFISQKYDFHSLGGESVQDVKERIEHFFSLVKSENIDNFLIVTHGAIIRFLYFFLETERTQKVDNLSLHEFYYSK